MGKVIRFFRFFLPAVLVCMLLTFYADRLAVFAVNHFTDYRLSYERWGRNPFDRGEIEGFRLVSGDKGFIVDAEKARFIPDLALLFKRGQLAFGCELDGVLVDNIPVVPLLRGQKYERIRFKALLDKDTVRVSDLTVFSTDVCMEGGYTLDKGANNISIELKISFSPEIMDKLPAGIRNGILSPGEDGWYSTVISYKGNLRVFNALYSFAAGSII